MGAKKSTKKFEKKHLRDTIDRRRDFVKVKQRHKVQQKKNLKNAAKSDENEKDENSPASDAPKADAFVEMDVDDFFSGGYDIAQTPAALELKKSKKVASKTGKRKRSDENDDASTPDKGGKQSPTSDEIEASDSSDSDDIDAHKGQLEALKEKDPEFYKYLQENDAELLGFGDHGDLAEIDELSEDEAEQESTSKKQKKEKEEPTMIPGKILKMPVVKQWQKSMSKQHSLRATRQAVLAFRIAAYVDEEDAADRKFAISDPDVYHEVLITALEHVPKTLNHHLPIKESASGKLRVSLDSKKFKTLTPLIKSHASSTHQLLSTLSDAAALKLTISSIEPMLPYLLQFRKLLKVLIKSVVAHWSETSNSEATRITAFLILRKLMVIGDAGIRETVLKASYEGIVKGSRNTSVHTLSGINLMKNSAAELWGIDQDTAYTTGFTFIRQLAIHLRSSISNPTKDSYKTVYNWQYTHSLDFWSRTLSAHCDPLVEAKAGKQCALRPLIYPVVQITLGAMRLIPTAQYFPLRFQLVRSLLRLSLSTGTYIPLTSALLEVLNSAEMKKAPKPSTLKPLDFTTTIRAPKAYLRTRPYQDGVAEEVSELLSEFFTLWTKHIAFPELALPVIVMLKRWLKEVSSRSSGNKNPKITQIFTLLIQKLEANSRWIEERRSKVTFAPRNRTEVDKFLKEVEWEATPLGAFVKTQRAQRAERAKLLESSRKEEREKKGKDVDVFEPENSEDDDDGGQHISSAALRKLEDDIVARSTGIVSELNELTLQDQSKIMTRPGYGTIGAKAKLWANYFEVHDDDLKLYQYDVHIAPQKKLVLRQKRQILVSLLQENALKNLPIASNYVNKIVCTKELSTTNFTIQCREPELSGVTNSRSYEILLVLQTVFRINELMDDLRSPTELYNSEERHEAIQALNIIFAHYPNSLPDAQPVGQSRHFRLTAGTSALGGGLDAVGGYFHSVRPSTGRLLLNLNVSTGTFYHGGPLSTLISQIDNRSWSGAARAFHLEAFLQKLRVKTSYSNSGSRHDDHVRTILCIAKRNGVPGTIHNIRFEWLLDGRTRETSVRDYYRQAHGIWLSENHQIVVDVGTKTKPIFLPAELCTVIPGQTAHRQLSKTQMGAMIKVACRSPDVNAQEIMKGGLSLMGIDGTADSNIRRLRDFGLNIEPKMVALTGFVLKPPCLRYSKPLSVQPGGWNLANNLMFNRPAIFPPNSTQIIGYVIMTSPTLGKPPSTIQFIERLGEHLRKYGLNLPKDKPTPRKLIELSHDSEQNEKLIDNIFSEIKMARWAFTIVILPEQDTEVYSQVKYSADVKHGFHTLCVAPKLPKQGGYNAVREINTHPSCLANLALKVNLKLGGVNHQLETPQNDQFRARIMYLGIDVTHPTGTDSIPNAPSIAGVVANCDSLLGQWPASLRVQERRVEIVQSLSEMVIERLKSWKDQKFLPQKIVVYRDGVSESQYQQVLDSELNAINNAIETYYGTVCRPKVTMIIVGKRHHTRFYPANREHIDERSGNVVAGTVVDRGCTMVRNFDFFLVAHTGIKGTSRPAHYVVLSDESKFPADELQAMTHNLSYVFGRATRSVSIATPAYYADILCERGRCYLYDVFHRKHNASASTYQPETSKWISGVHRDLAGSMFYI
ncbi:Nucleolar Complex 2 protein [Myotisia sp. PD_48]|nr:Nucleolar Complex 2 protein [Myotisia sp. PD_48]